MSVTQRIVDHGWEAFKKAHGNVFTKVGFPEDGTAAEGEKTMSRIIQVAAVHEFGAPSKNIPERSFLRTALDENRVELQAFKQQAYRQVAAGSLTLKQAISRVGEWMTWKVKQRIRSGPFEPLKPRTIAARRARIESAKGKAVVLDKPLIDTGQLFTSVQHTEVGV